MLIYSKLLSLLCLIEALLYPIDTKGLENGYHFKFFAINRHFKDYHYKMAVDDYFDGLAGRGLITITKKNSTRQYFYDLPSNAAFIIDVNSVCRTIVNLTIFKNYITVQWLWEIPGNISEGAFGPVAYLLKEDGSFKDEKSQEIWSVVRFIFKPGLYRPFGLGCKRPLNDDQKVPKLAIESNSFTLKMEANLYHNSIDSINMVKHNGVFSYDVSGEPPLRIIHVPSLLIHYTIDLSTDQCHFTESILVKGSYLRWPYDMKYFQNNLLSPLLLKLERQELNYLGTEQLESISYEVFEKTVDDFWLTDYAIGPVVITYFIPTSGVNKRPIKIRMLQHNGKGHQEYLITYQENTDAFTNNPSRFDLRNCFNTEPTWFQIVFPVVPRAIFSMNYLEYFLETELRERLDFIPINRLPVIKVGHSGPSIYVTFGLLDGVDVKFKFIGGSLSVEPNVITIEDNDEDCSFLCSDNLNCNAFSYCHNRRCNLFTVIYSQTPLPIITENCTLFVSRTLNIESDKKKDQPNQIASTSKLLHRINLMIQEQKLNLEIDGVSINAQHLFIVSHPDELGGYGEMYKDVVGQRMQLNEYRTIRENYELIGDDKLFDLSRLDCLTYCQNDDDCSVISYCATRTGECIISSLSADEIVVNSNKYTELNDHCSISAKSYTGNFNLLPGRSLGKPVLHEIKSKSPEECAKACISEKAFNCDAFDYCSPDLINTHCFLYMFHSETNVSAKNSSQIWNNDEKSCDHFARKLSKEYSQFIGRKFSEHDSVIATIEQNSLENCASSCNSIKENCLSFEYCQFTDETQSKILRTCRLSSNRILTQNEHTQKTNDFCSVYSILRSSDHVQRSLPFDKVEEHPHFYLTLFAGFVAVISGTIISAFLTSLFLAKKQS